MRDKGPDAMTDKARDDDQPTWVEVKEAEHEAAKQAAKNVKEPTVVVKPQ